MPNVPKTSPEISSEVWQLRFYFQFLKGNSISKRSSLQTELTFSNTIPGLNPK